MTKLDNYINMLQEFDYKKNGKELTINFLILMLELIHKEEDWIKDE